MTNTLKKNAVMILARHWQRFCFWQSFLLP